jgi:3-deoxy-manno-octulosonate cytidylyltransferase (CMP-KDO synthetase)
MIQHVYENAARAIALDRVLVATDDRRIEATVRGFGGEVMMTAKKHASGTDRLAEVARKIKADWIVNVQGDLPFIGAQTITRAVKPLQRNRSVVMGTVCTPIYDEGEWRNPNTGDFVIWGFMCTGASSCSNSRVCAQPPWSKSKAWSNCGRWPTATAFL